LLNGVVRDRDVVTERVRFMGWHAHWGLDLRGGSG